MAPPKTVTDWLKPATSAKRKRDHPQDEEAQDVGEQNNIPSRKAKTPKKAKSAQSKKTTVVSSKEAKKLYSDTLKAIDKGIGELDKRVKAMDPNSWDITTADYAITSREHLGTAEKLITMDPILAFNLLLSMADASHTDLNATVKMCGTGCDESTPTFEMLDEALLPLIQEREIPPSPIEALPEIPKRWTREDADVGAFKTGRPNKQQRGQMYRQKMAWENNRRQKRRDRREKAQDWVKTALSDLVEDRDYLSEYGVEGYLPRCIAKLEELVATREEE
ncbi:glycoside hydrolase family 43 [Fusarium albosuccineum]|uniref:Glycoside hydrolase family 43 n=1 Tax=Fusarium albosuccineum TaxID=1237068 RepID=A0A8H4L6E3_9HYPO|nr:glycoside hydrolase family 43 [Fusarium albosuccineum]